MIKGPQHRVTRRRASYHPRCMSGHLLINEIFHSIQGESTWAGRPCTFIRLRGCHLRCSYCDTEYAFKEGAARSIDSIIQHITQWPTRLVQITGGEPLLQANVHELITRLCDDAYTVLIETSGACDISVCDARAIRIVDLKTPGSGEAERNLWSNIDDLREQDEIKFVITDRPDYDWACQVIDRFDLPARCSAVLMSAVFEQAGSSEIAGCEALSPRDLAPMDARIATGQRPDPYANPVAQVDLGSTDAWCLMSCDPSNIGWLVHVSKEIRQARGSAAVER